MYLQRGARPLPGFTEYPNPQMGVERCVWKIVYQFDFLLDKEFANLL